MSALDDILAKDAGEIDVLEWAVILMPKEKAEEAAEKLATMRKRISAYEDVVNDLTPDGWMQDDRGEWCISCSNKPEQGHAADCKYTIATLENK